MGMAIGIWIECLAPSENSECILSLGDNTSAVGWLFRSSHVDAASLTFDAIQLVARKVATCPYTHLTLPTKAAVQTSRVPAS